MIRAPHILRTVALLLAAATLSGCISLLPKSKPVQLYRFGEAPVAEGGAMPAAGTVSVLRSGGVFQRQASGDRLLTITGEQAAYIAQSRWVAPAEVLFEQAVVAAFDADPGPVRLIARGEPATAAHILRIDVRNFETRYDQGAEAAPLVLVRLRVALISSSAKPRALVSEQMFEASARAGDNRVSAIVGAYDKAVAEVLSKTVAWTNGQATGG